MSIIAAEKWRKKVQEFKVFLRHTLRMKPAWTKRRL